MEEKRGKRGKREEHRMNHHGLAPVALITMQVIILYLSSAHASLSHHFFLPTTQMFPLLLAPLHNSIASSSGSSSKLVKLSIIYVPMHAFLAL